MAPVGFQLPRGALWVVTLGALACLAQPTTARLCAQGVTTAAIGGSVRSANGSDADGARVRVVNRATGYVVEAPVRRGRFLVAGLEVGGPYVVSIRQIGFAPLEREGLFLSLGQQLDLDFVLEPLANRLDTVHVVSSAGQVAFVRSRAGTGATISDSLLGRMPALNRDVFDFVRLVPQAGTRFGGLSGAGVGYRFNSYVIDGVSERFLFTNATLSGTFGGKPISIDAVKEYEVLLAPYDVRYGDFAGALVNAVTKSGTNKLHGSAFAYGRNEALARNTPFLRNTPFWRSQIGLAVGGPIIRDRAHFFVSTEVQHHEQPAPGPYLDQSNTSGTRVPVSEADVERFADILRGYGLDPGSGARVNRTNPNVNVFARVDVSLPRMKSRLVLRHNYARADMTIFNRAAGSSAFPLSSNAWTQRLWRSGTTVQVFTHLRDGALNEFLVSPGSAAAVSAQYTRSPLITVTVPGVGVPTAVLVAGPPENGQAFGALNTVLEVADHLVVRPGIRHTLSVGARAEIFSARNTSTRRQFGTWTFSSLDSLQRGEASGFRVEKDFGSATARLRGVQASAYIGDAWHVTDRLSITSGLRADLLAFRSRPLYSRVVDSVFGRRTSDFPRPALHWSPRVGFSWDLDAARQSRIRGGAGIFVGRPPLTWVHQSRRFDGVGNRGLLCRGGTGVVPRFVPDPWNPPTSCADGSGFAEGLVNLVDAHLRMTEMFRASLAYDRPLAWDVASSVEALYTRTRSDFVFVNPNLKGPVGVDRRGRVLYGGFNAAGVATPALVSRQYEEITDLRNHSQGHSLALTGRLEKRFSPGLAASVAYTRARVRDVQSLIATRG
ncbi:MAG: carboxypeptidase regulatory-like domain-containing protein, partial [Gemmatimonadaceae bacterium]